MAINTGKRTSKWISSPDRSCGQAFMNVVKDLREILGVIMNKQFKKQNTLEYASQIIAV